MSKQSTVKFLKFDAYGNSTFTSTEEIDGGTYEELKSVGEKLESMFPYAFNPVYHSSQYNSVSIRFDKDDSLQKRLRKNGVYVVNWNSKTRQKQGNGERYAILRIVGKPLFVHMEQVEEEDLEL